MACNPKTGANCKWQMIDTGQGWVYSAPQFAPTGESLFLTGAGSNAYSYSDPKADALIKATLTDNGLGAIQDTTRTTWPSSCRRCGSHGRSTRSQ